MVEKWNDYDLPQSAVINGTEYAIYSDYKSILECMKVLNNPDLVDSEKIECALTWFYKDSDEILGTDLVEAIETMMLFIGGNRQDKSTRKEKPLMDWEKDLNIIIAPINRVAGHDIRLDDNLHWWTFLSYFMEIGECTFNTYVGIRHKKNKGKKLEKYEEEIYKNNIEAITLGKRVDRTTQEMIDEILGKR